MKLLFCENQGGMVKTVARSKLSTLCGSYHEQKEPVVMIMGSIDVWPADPPVIVWLN